MTPLTKIEVGKTYVFSNSRGESEEGHRMRVLRIDESKYNTMFGFSTLCLDLNLNREVWCMQCDLKNETK